MPAVPKNVPRSAAAGPAAAGGEKEMDLAESVRSAKDMLSQLSDAVISASKAREEQKEKTGHREVKCQPWSRQGFFDRLRSFSAATWFNKPAMISPTECARHGWKNDGVDALLCESCKQRVSMSIHPSLNDASRRAVVVKLHAQMTQDGHGELCPWRDNPVPVSLTQLHGSSSHEVIWDCAHRMKSLYKCDVLPEVCRPRCPPLPTSAPPPPLLPSPLPLSPAHPGTLAPGQTLFTPAPAARSQERRLPPRAPVKFLRRDRLHRSSYDLTSTRRCSMRRDGTGGRCEAHQAPHVPQVRPSTG